MKATFRNMDRSTISIICWLIHDQKQSFLVDYCQSHNKIPKIVLTWSKCISNLIFRFFFLSSESFSLLPSFSPFFPPLSVSSPSVFSSIFFFFFPGFTGSVTCKRKQFQILKIDHKHPLLIGNVV